MPVAPIKAASNFIVKLHVTAHAARQQYAEDPVDNEADTQQFMMPVTVPLIFSIVVGLSFVLNNPDGSVAYWLSLFPLTSPIIMMIRVPFGVNIYTDLIPSMALLVIGFLATTWIAAKIYRTGILMYGKKVTYKELWKWLTYRA